MVLRRINQKKQEEEPEVEYEEEEEEPIDIEPEKREIKTKIDRLNNLPKLKQKSSIVKVVNKENIPLQRLETIQGESGEIYEVITIEEALTEILSILRDNA